MSLAWYMRKIYRKTGPPDMLTLVYKPWNNPHFYTSSLYLPFLATEIRQLNAKDQHWEDALISSPHGTTIWDRDGSFLLWPALCVAAPVSIFVSHLVAGYQEPRKVGSPWFKSGFNPRNCGFHQVKHGEIINKRGACGYGSVKFIAPKKIWQAWHLMIHQGPKS